jgi:hypothetical protein
MQDGLTSFQTAVKCGYIDIAKLLLEVGGKELLDLRNKVRGM